MDSKMEFEGMDKVQRKLDTFRKHAPQAFAASLWQGAQDIQRRSVTKTPVDTGHLKRSWVVQKPEINEFDISVVVGYSAHYALWVHERVELSHTSGGAKFLEKAIDEEAGDFKRKLAKRIQKKLESADWKVPGESSGPDYDSGNM